MPSLDLSARARWEDENPWWSVQSGEMTGFADVYTPAPAQQMYLNQNLLQIRWVSPGGDSAFTATTSTVPQAELRDRIGQAAQRPGVPLPPAEPDPAGWLLREAVEQAGAALPRLGPDDEVTGQHLRLVVAYLLEREPGWHQRLFPSGDPSGGISDDEPARESMIAAVRQLTDHGGSYGDHFPDLIAKFLDLPLQVLKEDESLPDPQAGGAAGAAAPHVIVLVGRHHLATARRPDPPSPAAVVVPTVEPAPSVLLPGPSGVLPGASGGAGRGRGLGVAHRVEEVVGSLLDLGVDAVVSPADESLLGGVLGGELVARGGGLLLAELGQVRAAGVGPGDPVVTTAPGVVADWLVHVVVPPVVPAEVAAGLGGLRAAYGAAVRRADELGFATVAVPLPAGGDPRHGGVPAGVLRGAVRDAVAAAATRSLQVVYLVQDDPGGEAVLAGQPPSPADLEREVGGLPGSPFGEVVAPRRRRRPGEGPEGVLTGRLGDDPLAELRGQVLAFLAGGEAPVISGSEQAAMDELTAVLAEGLGRAGDGGPDEAWDALVGGGLARLYVAGGVSYAGSLPGVDPGGLGVGDVITVAGVIRAHVAAWPVRAGVRYEIAGGLGRDLSVLAGRDLVMFGRGARFEVTGVTVEDSDGRETRVIRLGPARARRAGPPPAGQMRRIPVPVRATLAVTAMMAAAVLTCLPRRPRRGPYGGRPSILPAPAAARRAGRSPLGTTAVLSGVMRTRLVRRGSRAGSCRPGLVPRRQLVTLI